MEKREVKRGEVFYADLSPVVGSEQGGVRPVLIVQNDIGNRFSPTVIAAAITSKQDKTNLPTHIPVKAGTGGRLFGSVTAADVAAALAEGGYTVDKKKISLSSPLREAGSYDVELKLFEGVSAKIVVKVEAVSQ